MSPPAVFVVKESHNINLPGEGRIVHDRIIAHHEHRPKMDVLNPVSNPVQIRQKSCRFIPIGAHSDRIAGLHESKRALQCSQSLLILFPFCHKPSRSRVCD